MTDKYIKPMETVWLLIVGSVKYHKKSLVN